MKNTWDYSLAGQGGKTSVKIHNAPGNRYCHNKNRRQFLMEYWMGFQR